MSGTNQFLPFATQSGANTLTPSAYAALTTVVGQGFQPGLASSRQANTVWRQATFVAAAVAQLIANDGNNANDDGNLTGFVTNLTTAIKNIFVPSGTRMVFAQAAAPTGWTQDVSDTANNRMMRVVNDGTGNGVAGSADPTIMNVVPYHTHGFTTGGMNSNNPHSHGVYDPGHNHYSPVSTTTGSGTAGAQATGQQGAVYTGVANTGIGINNADINHSHSGGTDGGSSQTNWAPRYVNLIICQKN
jgi:hypothetical protein